MPIQQSGGRRPPRSALFRRLAVLALLLAPLAAPASAALTVTDSPRVLGISDGRSVVNIVKNAWQLSWSHPDGSPIVSDARPGLINPVLNTQYPLMLRPDGLHKAYPGLPLASYAPLGYLTSSWQAVTSLRSYTVQDGTVVIEAATSDGQGAEVRLSFGADGALQLGFTPHAAEVEAVEASFDAPLLQAYFGAGQRFGALNQRGRSVPLWLSHGGGSDRYLDTNEIATPFFWSPSGWGLWSQTDARGEIDFGDPLKRGDAINVMHEDDHLSLVLYAGTPQQILSAHTARSGRPLAVPPSWMWRPMVWQDDNTTTASVNALVAGMASRGIPLGAVWLDNPWDAGYGSFDFDPTRFPDPDALIQGLHGQGVRLMVWVSPFVDGSYQQYAASRNWLVTGTRSDGNDATYYPPRSIDAHLDFTNPAAAAWWTAGLQALVARGVDGVKMDRCEEDLSETSVWANGLPNRLNHNPYCVLYHQAAWKAFQAQRPDGDFVILARGGWTGDSRYAGHWAGDNLSLSGQLGLVSVRNSLLSQSASGFPFSGSDIGGYDGTRQSGSGARIGLPSVQAYMRWAQLGALSPVMETPIPPWWVSDDAVRVYRRYAVLHDRLAPYTAQYAALAVSQGVPIVRPLAYAYPDDAAAVATEDEYLYGPDLLVAPAASVLVETGVVTRAVYLPAGRWVDFWTGAVLQGPATVVKLAPEGVLPLYVREGAQLPPGVSAAELP